jgi:hypothetical protein
MVKSRLASLLPIILAISWLSVTARAEGGLHHNLEMHLVRQGVGAFADIDGDHIPDFASGINVGHTDQGYSYRVDLDLSGNPHARPFSVLSQEAAGLNIEAIDVDGDHDLDLVITARLSRTPIGVWLNDGEGGFTPGDIKNPSETWKATASVQSPGMAAAGSTQSDNRRPQLKVCRKREACAAAPPALSAFEFSSSQYSWSFTGPARLRAPPLSLT